MTETEATRLLAELADRYRIEPYDPARDLTLRDIAAYLRCSRMTADHYAQTEVDAGRMTERQVTVNGHRTNVYRKAQ